MGYNVKELTTADGRDVVLDSKRDRVFVSTQTGDINVFSTLTGAKLASWHVADALGAISLSEDGSFLLASDARQPLLYKVSTLTGVTSSIIFGNGNAYSDVEIVDQNTAIATGSNPVTINLNDNSIKPLAGATYYSGYSILTEDKHLTLGGETGISNGPLFLYDDRTHSIVARGDSYQSPRSGFNYGVQAVSEAAGMALQFIYGSSLNVYDLNLKYQRTINIGYNAGGLAFNEAGTKVYVLLADYYQPTKLVVYDSRTFNTIASYEIDSVGSTNSSTVRYGNNLVVSDDESTVIITDPATGATSLLALGVTREGGEGADQIIGSIGDDTLRGQGGDDTITGGMGDDRIVGGLGIDTAVFGYDLSQVTSITRQGNALVISGPEGVDALEQIEAVRFADGSVDLASNNIHVDSLFYAKSNYDVFRAGVNPAQHYALFGAKEGRDPNPYFSISGYLGANPDVKASGVDALSHYLQFGRIENRDPSINFDTELYLLHNPDVARAGSNPLSHYLYAGQAEGRAAYAMIGDEISPLGFDKQYYILGNPDVAASGTDAYKHYVEFGYREGRNPSAWFDSAGYLLANPDVAAAGVNPLQHYHEFGWKEGRDPSAQFDTEAYLAANPDVAAAKVDPLTHYLQFGAFELRESQGDGIQHGSADDASRAFVQRQAGADDAGAGPVSGIDTHHMFGTLDVLGVPDVQFA